MFSDSYSWRKTRETKVMFYNSRIGNVLLKNPSEINDFYVYQYTFLDDLSFIRTPDEVFIDDDSETVQTYVNAIRDKFITCGWEGDGDIGIIWVPPFMLTETQEDSWGLYIWHVKQINDGISWIASNQPIYSEILKTQNIEIFDKLRSLKGVPENIIQTETDIFLNNIKYKKKHLLSEYEFLTERNNENSLSGIIFEKLLNNSQNNLVAELNTYIDECFLRILDEVLTRGNKHNIKISKSKAFISSVDYNSGYDDFMDDLQSFTLRGIIKDIWESYKFEPFKIKIDKLFNSVDFKPDKVSISEILKHVNLRNCIQHHQGQIPANILKRAGINKFSIKTEKEDIELLAWHHVIFTINEIENFCDVLSDIANKFCEHISVRVPTRFYRYGDKHR